MNSLDIIDKILEFLKNKTETSVNEVKKTINLNQEKVMKLLELIEAIGFIKVEGEKIVITELGVKFLELPPPHEEQ